MFRKDIESVYKTVFDANEIVQTLLTDDMKMELNEQVLYVQEVLSIHIRIDKTSWTYSMIIYIQIQCWIHLKFRIIFSSDQGRIHGDGKGGRCPSIAPRCSTDFQKLVGRKFRIPPPPSFLKRLLSK